MRLDIVRNARRNMAASVLLNAVKTVLPFVNRTLLLWFIGVEYLGLNGLFVSVLSVLSVAELGFGEAIQSALYRPVATDDRPLICAYLAVFRRIYRVVGVAIFLVGLCLVPFVPAFVRGGGPADVDLRLLYLIHLASTASSYFVFAYRGPILGAHQRTDVADNILTAVLLLQYAVVIPVVVFLRSYYLYVMATVAFTLAGNVLVMASAKRMFPWAVPAGALPPDLRRKLVSDVKSILLNKIGATLSFQANALVISAFLGLEAVAIYGNYNNVLVAVSGFVGSMRTATAGGFGNRIHTHSRMDNFETLLRANRLAMVVVVWVSAMLLALYQPFMEVWMRGRPELVRHFATPLVMVAWFAVRQSRAILLSFKSGAAMWREDRWKSITNGAADLCMNLAFVHLLPAGWKLDGVILSTVVANLLIQIPWETRVVFARFFGRSRLRQYLRQELAMAAFGVVLCALALGAAALVPGGGIVRLFAKGAAAAVVSGTVVLALFGRELAAVALRREGSGKRNIQ